MQKANFNQVLEMAESLSESEQDFLIEILQKRLGEKRRNCRQYCRSSCRIQAGKNAKSYGR